MLQDVIQVELDSGKIEGYSKGLLYIYFKALGYQVLQYIPTLFYIYYLLAIILYIKSNIIQGLTLQYYKDFGSYQLYLAYV